MSNKNKNLNKVLEKYYEHVLVTSKGESTEDIAARILQEMQNYKMLTIPEMFNFVKEAVSYLYPKREIPEVQKELLNEFFQNFLANQLVSKMKEN